MSLLELSTDQTGASLLTPFQNLGLPPKLDEASPSVPPASHGVVVDVLGGKLAEGANWDLADIPLSGVIDIHSSLQGDLFSIQKKCDEFSLNLLSNAGDVFRQALHGLKTLAEQHQLHSCFDMLLLGARDSAAFMQLLERQGGVQSADLDSACGDMTRIGDSVTVAQLYLSNPQFALVTVKEENDEYCCRLGVVEQRRFSLKALFGSAPRRLIDHAFSLDSVRSFLCQVLAHNLEVYLRATFTAVLNCSGGFRSAASNLVARQGVTLLQDVSSVLTHV